MNHLPENINRQDAARARLSTPLQPLDYFLQLQSLTSAVYSAGSVRTVVEALGECLLAATGMDAGMAVFLSEDGNGLETLRLNNGHAEPLSTWQAFPMAVRSSSASTAEERRAVLYTKGAAFLAAFPEFANWQGASEAVGVIPMLAGEKAIGVIALSCPESHDFSLLEAAFLETAATLGAQAIQRVRLEEENRQAGEDSAQQTDSTLLKGILDKTEEVVFALDLEMRLLMCNLAFQQRFQATFGMSAVPGMNLLEWLADFPEQQARVGELWQRAFAGESFTVVCEFGKESQPRQILEKSYSPLRDREGRIIGAIHVSQDVTAKVEAEEALRKVASVLDEAQNVAHIGNWEADLVSGNVVWSDELFRLLEFDPAAGVPAYDQLLARFQPEDVPLHIAMKEQAIGTGEPRDFDIRVRHTDGSTGWLHVLGRSEKNEAGAVIRTLGTVRDITEQKQYEQEQSRLIAILESTSDFVATATSDGQLLYGNRAFRDFLGVTEAQVGSLTVRDLYAPESLDKLRNEILPATERDGHWSGESLYVSGKGDKVPVSLKVFVHKDAQGNALYRSAIIRDITEQKHAEVALRQSEARFHAFMNNSAFFAWITDVEGRFFYANASVAQRFDQSSEAMIGKSCYDFVPRAVADEYIANNRKVITSGQALETVEVASRRDGTKAYARIYRFPVEDGVYGTLIGGIGIDITERKILEANLQQAQKMEGIGRLAGGIAHDFNNLLSVILGYAELIELDLPEDSPMQSNVNAIAGAATRAANLTRQLLSFARRQATELKVIAPNTLIADMLQMLKPLIGEDILLHTDLESGMGRVRIDPNQLEQVLVNLVINARDAMPQGGTLTIHCGEQWLQEAQSHSKFVIPPGHYVCLTVSDTGTGMSEEVKARMFEPFFTTKEVGKGTGLGLAMVYGIVKQHNGYILVESAVGVGTAFTLYLPCTEDDLTLDHALVVETLATSGEKTILVVEDEPVLQELAVLILERKGYKVLPAANGMEAIEIASSYPGAIHLLMTDAIMPGMGGLELAEKLCQERPHIPVLLVSGYTEDRFPETIPPSLVTNFLNKPYSPGELLNRVSAVLAESASCQV